MKNQQGYIQTGFLSFLVLVGLIAIVIGIIAVPVGGYFAWESHKEREALIKLCERDLPRDQHCEIVLTAVAVKGES